MLNFRSGGRTSVGTSQRRAWTQAPVGRTPGEKIDISGRNHYFAPREKMSLIPEFGGERKAANWKGFHGMESVYPKGYL